MGIEFVGKDRVRIGQAEYRLFLHDPPLPGGRASVVEVSGKPHCGYQELLEIDQLKGVTANQLPKGFSISIYAPRLATKNIDSMEIRNAFGAIKLSFTVSHDYEDWKHPSNLIHFSNHLAAEFLKSVPDCASARSRPDDVNVSVTCELDMPRTAELSQYIALVDACVGQVIGRLLSGESKGLSTTHLKPDEHGYKWWVRYVLIPIAGSATLVALLNWVI